MGIDEKQDSPGPSRTLATFCAGLRYKDLPGDVIEKAKLCLLDYIANVYGSLELNAVNNVIDYFRKATQGGGTTVLGCGFKTNAQHAVFINGTTGEAIEAQDGLRFGGNHPGTAVIPAALAAAEETGASGQRIIEAIVAGYEAANRPAAAMHPWHTLSGFLPTGTCGAFGAAAAAAKIYGYDAGRTLNAVSNAGYLLPLSMAEQLMGGYTIKIVQGGQAAASGLLAAGLAGAGLTGFPQVLEGSALNGGFMQITTRSDPKIEKLSENLGAHFTISDVYFKPYSACRHTHGAIQASLELAAEQRFVQDDIDRINVFTYGIAQLAVGKGIQEKDSFVSAQFSIPYVTAAAIADGEFGPRQLIESRIADPKLIALSRKISVSTDDALNAMYPDKTATRVEITLKSGKTLSRQVEVPGGDPRTPMTREDIIAKVHAFGSKKKPSKIKQIVKRVLDLEHIIDIQEITETI